MPLAIVFACLVLVGCGVLGAQEGDTLLVAEVAPETPWAASDRSAIAEQFNMREGVRTVQLNAPSSERGRRGAISINLSVELGDAQAQQILEELCDYPGVVVVSSTTANRIGQPIDETVECRP